MSAIGDKVEVYIDGGIRNGTDVFKALALGAKAVFIGQPILWGLSYKVNNNYYRVAIVEFTRITYQYYYLTKQTV